MEILDHPGWLWGLSLIVLTMAIHATAVVMLAFVGMRMRVRLETRGLKVWNLIAILICVVGVIGLLLAVLHGIECGIWAAAYLWLGALDSPMDALFYSLELDEHARRIRADASTALALDGRAGGSRRDATVRCEHGVPFLGDAGVLVNAHRARDPQPRLSATAAKQGVNLPCPPAIDARRAVTPDRKGNARYGANATFLPRSLGCPWERHSGRIGISKGAKQATTHVRIALKGYIATTSQVAGSPPYRAIRVRGPPCPTCRARPGPSQAWITSGSVSCIRRLPRS